MKSKKTMLGADGVVKITRISKSSIQVRVETVDFAAPLRLNGPKNRAIIWRAEDLNTWFERLVATCRRGALPICSGNGCLTAFRIPRRFAERSSATRRNRYGPETAISSALDSILPSLVQMAPWAAQSVVAGSATVTSEFEDGWTVISHLTLAGRSSRRALVTSPPVSVNAWSRKVL